MGRGTGRGGPAGSLGPGTLYGAIKRLRKRGLIAEVETEDSGRARPYRATPLGRRVAAAEARRHKELVRWAEATGL